MNIRVVHRLQLKGRIFSLEAGAAVGRLGFLLCQESTMIRAKNIMTKDVITVGKNTPIYEAIELMAKHDISGMPVVNDDMTLVGILSEKDVIVLFYTNESGVGRTVSDFMTEPAIYFDENEDLVSVCDFLSKNIFRRVPVTSKGKVVGVISVRDILEHVLRTKVQKASVA
jgi:CBS domain-containing protein